MLFGTVFFVWKIVLTWHKCKMILSVLRFELFVNVLVLKIENESEENDLTNKADFFYLFPFVFTFQNINVNKQFNTQNFENISKIAFQKQ